jgi:hypothetical protein
MTKPKTKEMGNKAEQALQGNKPALSNLKQDSNLWYKVHVLLYDLRNIKSDRFTESRSLGTTDELYTSGPYFTPSEAACIKETIIEVTTDTEERTIATDTENSDVILPIKDSKTIEEAIKERLAGFYDKRRASGDSRPCGPHDIPSI